MSKKIKIEPCKNNVGAFIEFDLNFCNNSIFIEIEKAINKYGVLFFNIKDVVVIVEDWYILSNLSSVVLMSEENMLVLQRPIKFDGFLPPELVNINTLPFVADPTCAYYSLALLCLHTLGFDNKNEKDVNKLDRTKLYYLLKRCLEKTPKDRIFLYI